MTNEACKWPIGTFKDKLTGERVNAPCMRWDCPRCGKILKMRLLDRVNRGFTHAVDDLGLSVYF